MAIEEYNEFEPATIDDYSQPFEDTLAIDYTQSDTFTSPPDFDGSYLIDRATKGALAYGAYKGLVTVGRTLLDTQGYGNLPGAPEKYIQDSKKTQVWSNAMQASKSKTRLGAMKEIAHSVATDYPIELKAAKSSIKEVDELLTNPNLDAQTRANYELEKKSRVKNLAKRRGLLGNHFRALGVAPEDLTFNVGGDFEATTIKVDKTLAKLDPSMKRKLGQTVLATKHKGAQISDFRGYANRDARVRNIRSLMDAGDVSAAKKAAKNAHYLRKDKVVIPKRIKTKSGSFVPVNNMKTKEQMGMKLRKLPNKIKYNGKNRPAYRLGFVPKIPQNMSSKLEYVTGQHWQYMDFVKTNGGYHRFRGGMRDVHNLTPQKFGKIIGASEEMVAKPIVNFSDWKYNIITKAKNIKKDVKFSQGAYMTKAARRMLGYGGVEKASRKTVKAGKAARIALKALKAIGTRGRSLF